jgi:hypothetical protein
VRLMNLTDWLLGCSHRRTTLPMTHNDETYVVCLECGRQFAYDWARMRAASRWPFHRSQPDQPHGPNRDQPERDKY